MRQRSRRLVKDSLQVARPDQSGGDCKHGDKVRHNHKSCHDNAEPDNRAPKLGARARRIDPTLERMVHLEGFRA
jgi:hypothetical protein